MDEYLHFVNAIFCSSNCNFVKFSAHNMFLLLIFSLLFIIIYLQLSIPHCIVNKILNPKFNIISKFNYSKYNHRGLIFGGVGGVGLIHGRSFPFQKLVPKRPWAYTRWGSIIRILRYTVYIFYSLNMGPVPQNLD